MRITQEILDQLNLPTEKIANLTRYYTPNKKEVLFVTLEHSDSLSVIIIDWKCPGCIETVEKLKELLEDKANFEIYKQTCYRNLSNAMTDNITSYNNNLITLTALCYSQKNS